MMLRALTVSFFIAVITAHQASNPMMPEQQNQHQHHEQQPPTGGHHVPRTEHQFDREAIRDPEHIKEHLDGKMNTDKKLSDEEMQFHYFKVHDYDNNNMLDGIELISALTHYHKDQQQDAKPMSDQEIATFLDGILDNEDTNRDGYIDYAEFIMAQRRSNNNNV